MGKWIKLIGIAVGVTALILAINEFFFSGPKAQPSEAPAAVAAAVEPTPEPTPTATPTPTPPVSAPALVAFGANPYGTSAKSTPKPTPKPIPPRPQSLTKNSGQPKTSQNSSGSEGSSGGGSSGGGSSGGGSTAGDATDTTDTGTTDTTEETPVEEIANDDYWLQTGPDPAGTTPENSRHNKSCVKWKNVPGRNAEKTEGTVCPLCGG